ncbi:MAG TPA: hypothetical protein VGC08_03035 [Pedobacter sp.]
MINSLKRNIGINFKEDRTAEVRLWAPEAKSVNLNLPGLSLPLERKDFGYWELQTGAVRPGMKYKFLIDAESAVPDPASLLQPDGVHGVSEAYDLKKF